MSSHFEEVARSVESGTYFSDAQDWYLHKYIFPVSERTYFIFLTAFAILASISAITLMVQFLPLKKSVPIVVPLDDQLNFYTIIKPLRAKGEIHKDPNIVLIEYLVKKFVDSYESYNYEKLQRKLSFVKQFSSKNLFRRYQKDIRLSNPDSPLRKYRRHTIRSISIRDKSFELPGRKQIIEPDFTSAFKAIFFSLESPASRPNEHTAYVDFIATEKGPKKIKRSIWKARIDFIFSDVKFDHVNKKFLPLHFEVTRYDSEQYSESSN